MARHFHLLLATRQHELLLEEATRTGLPIAELIRRAIDRTYRPESKPTVGGFEVSFGIWRRPDAAVAGRRPKSLDGRSL